VKVLLGIVIAAAALAQVRPSLMEQVGNANLPALELHAGDLVAVSVYDAPELTRTVRVDPDGTIRLPLLAEGVKAAGLMPRELEVELTNALKSGEILIDPVVKITVVEYYSRPISVMGAVRKPVTFQSDGKVTLLEALSHAEGLTDDAGPEILVTQNDAVRRITVKRLLDGADPTVNLVLTGNEEVRVPVAGKIFVVGNIRKPGGFPVRDPGDSTAHQFTYDGIGNLIAAIDPLGNVTVNTYGTQFNVNDGLLLKSDERVVNGNALKTTT